MVEIVQLVFKLREEITTLITIIINNINLENKAIDLQKALLQAHRFYRSIIKTHSKVNNSFINQ